MSVILQWPCCGDKGHTYPLGGRRCDDDVMKGNDDLRVGVRRLEDYMSAELIYGG
jgi:hypothetical protein